MKSLVSPWVESVQELVCISRSGVSVPLHLVESSDANPAGLQKSHMLWRLLLTPAPQAGELGVGHHTLTPVGEPLRYSHLPVGGLSPGRYWI